LPHPLPVVKPRLGDRVQRRQ